MKKRKVQAVIFYHDANNKKQFLLLQMNERRKFLWQNVTGSVEKDEKYRKAAIREAMEETGIKKKNIKHIYKSGMKFKFCDQINLILFVTGSHLDSKYGNTWKIIEDDNFVINEKIYMNIEKDSPYDILQSMAIELKEMSK